MSQHGDSRNGRGRGPSFFQSAEGRRRDLDASTERLAADRLAGVLRRLDSSSASQTTMSSQVASPPTSDAGPALHPGALPILRSWRLRVDTSGLKERLSSEPGSAQWTA